MHHTGGGRSRACAPGALVVLSTAPRSRPRAAAERVGGRRRWPSRFTLTPSPAGDGEISGPGARAPRDAAERRDAAAAVASGRRRARGRLSRATLCLAHCPWRLRLRPRPLASEAIRRPRRRGRLGWYTGASLDHAAPATLLKSSPNARTRTRQPQDDSIPRSVLDEPGPRQ